VKLLLRNDTPRLGHAAPSQTPGKLKAGEFGAARQKKKKETEKQERGSFNAGPLRGQPKATEQVEHIGGE